MANSPSHATTTTAQSPTRPNLKLYVGRDPVRLARIRQERMAAQRVTTDQQQPSRQPVESVPSAGLSRSQLLSRLARMKVSKRQVEARRRAIVGESASQARFARVVRNHLSAFDNDAASAFAAQSIVFRPSTTLRYAKAACRLIPEQRTVLKAVIGYAQKQMSTVRGRPKTAERFDLADFARLLRTMPNGSRRDALILMWASASRAVDLLHFNPVLLTIGGQSVWKIELVVVEEDEHHLHAPKSDLTGKRKFIKWIPADPLIRMHEKWPTWEELYPLMKSINSTPHAIRGTAINMMEEWGEPEASILCLTAHAMRSTLASYAIRSPNDPGALTARRLSERLLLTLKSHLDQPIHHTRSTTATNP